MSLSESATLAVTAVGSVSVSHWVEIRSALLSEFHGVPPPPAFFFFCGRGRGKQLLAAVCPSVIVSFRLSSHDGVDRTTVRDFLAACMAGSNRSYSGTNSINIVRDWNWLSPWLKLTESVIETDWLLLTNGYRLPRKSGQKSKTLS